MSAPASARELCQLIEKSELIDANQLAPFLQQLEQPECQVRTAKECANSFVKEGMLTLFQAKLLLKGKWRNFFIGGKYKVLEHLGSGGMGTVYLCEHRFMRRRVAIKLLPTDKCLLAGGLERFQREAQAAARLNHPNIVQAHDIGQDGPIHFLVMEYIDGVSLQHLVDNRGPLAVPRAINYVCQAAQGLAHAHKMNLIHRDIKPNNLLLDRAGTIKILDLGLARFADSNDNLTQLLDTKTVLGTADYLAPEQALCSTVDIRADIYSLGCLFHFLLLGRPPFDGVSVAQKMVKHQLMIPTPVHLQRPEIPEQVSQILQVMMAKKPAERYQTPQDVFDALRPWLEPVPAPTPDELPLFRYSHHRDVDTLSKVSTISGLPATNLSQISRISPRSNC